MLILVMGVRGAGKTPLAQELASVMGYKFIDSSELYSESIIKKLNNQEMPDEIERKEFLSKVKAVSSKALIGGENVVLSCPALREKDREEILSGGNLFKIIYLENDSVNQKQSEVLEPPREAIRVKGALPIHAQVDVVLQSLSLQFAA